MFAEEEDEEEKDEEEDEEARRLSECKSASEVPRNPIQKGETMETAREMR